VETAPAEGTTPAECDACQPGQYCAGGQANAVDCGDGDWDEDEDPATPCIEQTVCPAGQYISATGSALVDQKCAACDTGSFSPASQSAACTTWQHCDPGTYVAMSGSSTQDRTCTACATGTFSTTEDAPDCANWTVCAAPNSYVAVQPNASRDRVCDLCEPPEVTFRDNLAACALPSFQMDEGTVSIEAENFHVLERHGSNHSWSRASEPLASGGSSMDVTPDAGYTWEDSSILDFAPRLDFRVTFDTTGTFYIHLRGDPGGTGGGSDSCFAGVDGSLGPPYDFDDQMASWGWRTQSVVVDTEGQHIVSVWAREDGFRLDKIVVSTSQTAPTGEGPAQSPHG
jgi:hypothetical protein